MNLMEAQEGKQYIIQRIETDDEELDAFLFSLGCYPGESGRIAWSLSRTADTASTTCWLRPS